MAARSRSSSATRSWRSSGSPSIHEDDALRGVRAAFEMREATDDLNQRAPARWGVAIFTRTGVNTGPSSPARATKRSSPAIPSMSPRASSRSRHERDHDRRDHLRAHEGCDRRRSHPAAHAEGEGSAGGRLPAAAVTPHAEGHARRMDSPIVGRQAEIAAVREVLESTVAGEEARCRSITLLGHPGVGKSRLAEEVINAAGTRWVVLRGRCLPYGEGITFWPLLEAVREAVGITESDDADMATAKLAVLADGDGTVAMQVAQVVGIREAEAPAHELFGAVRTFFMSLAARRPLLLLFDDIHWGEPTFLSNLRRTGWDFAPLACHQIRFSLSQRHARNSSSGSGTVFLHRLVERRSHSSLVQLQHTA